MAWTALLLLHREYSLLNVCRIFRIFAHSSVLSLTPSTRTFAHISPTKKALASLTALFRTVQHNLAHFPCQMQEIQDK